MLLTPRFFTEVSRLACMFEVLLTSILFPAPPRRHQKSQSTGRHKMEPESLRLWVIDCLVNLRLLKIRSTSLSRFADAESSLKKLRYLPLVPFLVSLVPFFLLPLVLPFTKVQICVGELFTIAHQSCTFKSPILRNPMYTGMPCLSYLHEVSILTNLFTSSVFQLFIGNCCIDV